MQMTLVDGTREPSVTTESAPFDLDAARFDVWRSGPAFLDADPLGSPTVTDGEWRLGPEQVLLGNCVRGSGQPRHDRHRPTARKDDALATERVVLSAR